MIKYINEKFIESNIIIGGDFNDTIEKESKLVKIIDHEIKE